MDRWYNLHSRTFVDLKKKWYQKFHVFLAPARIDRIVVAQSWILSTGIAWNTWNVIIIYVTRGLICNTFQQFCSCMCAVNCWIVQNSIWKNSYLYGKSAKSGKARKNCIMVELSTEVTAKKGKNLLGLKISKLIDQNNFSVTWCTIFLKLDIRIWRKALSRLLDWSSFNFCHTQHCENHFLHFLTSASFSSLQFRAERTCSEGSWNWQEKFIRWIEGKNFWKQKVV